MNRKSLKALWMPLLGLTMMSIAGGMLAGTAWDSTQQSATAVTWVTTEAEPVLEQTKITLTSTTVAISETEFTSKPAFAWNAAERQETTISTVETSDSSESDSVTTVAIQKITTFPVEQTEDIVEASDTSISYPLDLNTASIEELDTLPGIGTILAERIVNYREQVGGFCNLEELMQVNGIGAGIYAQVAPYLFVAGEISEHTEEMPESFISPSLENTETPVAPAESVTSETTEPIPILDLNLATAEDLQQIPDITPELADSILRLRTQIQYFENVYELLYADGMTDPLFLSIRVYFTVNPQ